VRKLGFTRSHGLLVLAGFGFSFILVFSKLLKDTGMSSLQQLLFRIIIATPLIFLLIKGKVKLEREDLAHFILMGFVFSAFLLSSLSSIAFGCPLAVATALIYTQPFFTAFLAAIAGRERINAKKLAIVIVGVIGVFLASGIATEEFSSLPVLGVLFALFGGFLYAVYLFFKRAVKKSYAPFQALFNTFIFAGPCALILGLVLRFFTANPILVGFSMLSSYQFLLLVLFAVFSTALPYGFVNYVKTSEVSPTSEGTILFLDPVLHNFWAILFFQQYVSLIRYVGIVLILLSAAATLKIGGEEPNNPSIP
jgi:drug/metabolite transporter (DMT)-like permease